MALHKSFTFLLTYLNCKL